MLENMNGYAFTYFLSRHKKIHLKAVLQMDMDLKYLIFS